MFCHYSSQLVGVVACDKLHPNDARLSAVCDVLFPCFRLQPCDLSISLLQRFHYPHILESHVCLIPVFGDWCFLHLVIIFFHFTETDSDHDLAQPEFKGLWEQDIKGCNSTSGTVGNRQPLGGSLMEAVMLKSSLAKQRDAIVSTQIAAGRTFAGTAFYSKPDVVLFKACFPLLPVVIPHLILFNDTHPHRSCVVLLDQR